MKALIPTAISAFGAPVMGATLGVAITVSDFIDPLTVRPNLKYSYNEESYIKYNALYRHTMRSFYISDETFMPQTTCIMTINTFTNPVSI